MKKINKIFENLVVVISIFIVMFLLATMFLPRFGYSLIVVKSGSMEPTIKTGSILFAKKQGNYNNGDIITFVKMSNEIITHRIVGISKENGNIYYKTKGDANNATDMFLTRKSRVIGKTIFTIPYFGYIIGFLKSKIGIMFLIIIPAGYFIGREILKIKKELKNSA